MISQNEDNEIQNNEIKKENEEIVRKRVGVLERGEKHDGKMKYGLTLDGINEVIDMDSVYYVVIKR